MTPQIENIARNIKTLRNSLGASQTDFAERIGVSRDVINNLEHGRLQSIETKMPLFRLIAKEFGVDLDWLLHGSGEPTLPYLTEAEVTAELVASMLEKDDPVVLAFIKWWSRQTDADKRRITQAVIEFAEQLKKNME